MEAKEYKDSYIELKDRYIKLLLKGYANWMTMLMRSIDTIAGLVPTSPNLSKSEEKPSVVVTKELLAKFSSTETVITFLLSQMKRELEHIYKLGK